MVLNLTRWLPCPNQWRIVCSKYIAIPNVFVVETVDSAKKATTLDKACAAAARAEPLRIFLQVNTSGEESKHRRKAFIICARVIQLLPPIFLQYQCLILTTVNMFLLYWLWKGKSGMLPNEVPEVAQHVVSTCSHLTLAGLMTIGSPNPDLENGENPDFKVWAVPTANKQECIMSLLHHGGTGRKRKGCVPHTSQLPSSPSAFSVSPDLTSLERRKVH